MSVNGSNHFGNVNRIRALGPDQSEEREGREKKRSLHKGRSWSEVEEDLPLQPVISKEEESAQETPLQQLSQERAKKILEKLLTLEDKIAQICFYLTEASYDQEDLNKITAMIQNGQVSGLVFTQGDYKRQSYLIEYYQSLSKVPLITGNDFLHGLSFYFQGRPLPSVLFKESEEDNQHRFLDLGKAVMAQNRRLGIHFQFDCERRATRKSSEIFLSDKQMKAFRRGVREASGIAARERVLKEKEESSMQKPSSASFLSLSEMRPLIKTDCQETIGLRTLGFLDLSEKRSLTIDDVAAFFKHAYEAILTSGDVGELIQLIADAVRTGLIKEEEIERRALKVLFMKMHLFPKIKSF